MKLLFRPDRDSDNNEPFYASAEVLSDDSLRIELESPYRAIQISAEDMAAIIAVREAQGGGRG